YTGRLPALHETACPAGLMAVHVRVPDGSFLRIVGAVPDVDDTRVAVPEIGQRDMQSSGESFELKNDSKEFTAGRTMANTFDLKSGRYVWLVAPTSRVSGSRDVLQICGRDSPDQLSRQYGVFYA